MRDSYLWTPAYRQAVLETDDKVLRRRLDEARLILTVRLRGIGGASGVAERAAIDEVLQALKTLEKERLGRS